MSDSTFRIVSTLADFDPKTRVGIVKTPEGRTVFEVISYGTPAIGDELDGNFYRLGSETYINNTRHERMRVIVQSADKQAPASHR